MGAADRYYAAEERRQAELLAALPWPHRLLYHVRSMFLLALIVGMVFILSGGIGIVRGLWRLAAGS